MRRVSVLLFVVLTLAGCTGARPLGTTPAAGGSASGDAPMHRVADAYYDVVPSGTYLEHAARHAGGGQTSATLRFHSIEQVAAKIDAWNTTYPNLVDVRVIGKSREGRPLWDVVVTDKSVPPDRKVVPLLDGAHHGNEYPGGELILYTVDTLLENYATNASVRDLLRHEEIHAVPVVNPDGWVASTRYNSLGVNLNRNYDIDWGDAAGTSNPVMGKVSGTTGQQFGGVLLVAENCGDHAFSEPETQAMRDLMASLGPRLAVYFSTHSPSHAMIAPWAAFQAPFPLPNEHAKVLETELAWVRAHTEYQAGKAAWGNLSAGLPYSASGSSMDYFYATQHRPAFTLEVDYYVTSATSPDYPARLVQQYQGLRYWMDASVTIPLHMLANAQALANWTAPTAPALAPQLSSEELPPMPPGGPVPNAAPHLD